jgi:hypothetical protein
VLVDLGVGTSKVSLERRVQKTQLRPVGVESSDLLGIQTGVEIATLQGSQNSVDTRLGSHTRQAVGGGIDGIGTSLGASDHGSNTGTGRVVGVDVDGEVGVSLADRTDQESGGVGLQNTSHVLNTQDVDVELDKLVDKVQVVLQVVLLVGVLSKYVNRLLQIGEKRNERRCSMDEN